MSMQFQDYDTAPLNRQRKRGRPRKNAKSNPTVSQLLMWSQEDIQRWFHRDARMQEEQMMVELQRPQNVPEGEEVVVLNDPKVLVRKLAGMLSSRRYNIIATPFIPSDRSYAQNVKDHLKAWEKESTLDWLQQGHYRIEYEEAESVLQRGLICGRISLAPEYYDPDSMEFDPFSFPCIQFIADPANVYPVWGGDGLVRVTHRQWLTPREICDNSSFPDADPDDFDIDTPDRSVEVRSVYYFSKEWDFHAAIAVEGNRWLKKPKPMGYMPWIIAKAAGASYQGTKWDQTKMWQRYDSESILSAIRDTYKDMNKAASMFQTMLAKESNPTMVWQVEDPNTAAQEIKAGSRAVLKPNEHVQPMVTGPNLQHYENQFNLFQDRVNRATLPPAAWGSGPQAHSAMLQSQQIETGLDIIDPYIKAIKLFREMKYRKYLELFVKYFPSDTRIYAPKQASFQQPTGSWVDLTAAQIAQQGYYVEVEYDTMTLQERLALSNTVMGLVRDNVISRDSGRGPEWLNLENPLVENEKIVSESLYTNPEVMQQLAPIFAAQTGQEMLARLAQMVTQQPQQQGPPQGPPGGPPQPPQGAAQPAPGPGPAGPMPPPQMGVPTQMMNPQAMSGPLPPQLALLMQRMAAAQGGGNPALGGSGQGGLPPLR